MYSNPNLYLCDQDGNGPLHKELNLSTLDDLLKEGFSPHTFNSIFQSPIDVLIWDLIKGELNGKSPEHYLVLLGALLRQKFEIDDRYFDYIFGTTINQYNPAVANTEFVINFYASRLCGVDIDKISSQPV